MIRDYVLALAAGALQGVTEFLPVSSSGHLILFHHYFGFAADNLTFDIAVHFGTLLALLVYFWRDVVLLISGFFKSLRRFDFKNLETRLPWLIIIATLPAMALGWYAQKELELVFRNPPVVATMLISFGVMLLFADEFSTRNKTLVQIGLWSALFIGLAQAIALVPGVSRSGITIIAGLALGLNRETSARFAFLLAIPVVFGAFLLRLLSTSISADLVGIGFFGIVSSAVVGWLVIKYFLRFLQSHTLKVFGWYRIALGIGMLLVLI